MAHLSIRVFGGLQVSRDGETLSSFESDRVRALLAYLAVERDRPQPRETLAGLLWPESSETSARHNLSQALFNLRRVLGDAVEDQPYLFISRDTLQFNGQSRYTLDLEQFQAGLSAWESGRGQGNEDTARLEEAVGLYQGEFLQGFYLNDSPEFEEWVLVQRASAHQRVMAALNALASEHEKRGAFTPAQRACLRQLALDPWREEAHQQLMRLLAREGQRSAAFAQYEACRKLLADELGVEPSPETRELYEQIRRGVIHPEAETPARVSVSPMPRLPVPLSPFLGREKELAALGEMTLDPQCRCITLVGPGGTGKTRLALETAARNKAAFTHGAAFISLIAAGSLEAAVSAVASGTGLTFRGASDPRTQLANHLADKHLLLVLDNAEHLLTEGPGQEPITGLILDILAQSPQAKLLITSREALNIDAEWCFEVGGLEYPEGEAVDQAEAYSAVALFVQHARRVRPGFRMDAGSQSSITRLCRMVEGMPLAIELAAAWVRVLPVEEIAAEVERSLDFLNTQARDIPERHRSLRAVFDPSWQMLSLEEKAALCGLSVFRGGFTRQAAEQVAGAPLLVLSSLVIRSLVRRTASGRYDLHELVRQYAASILAGDAVEMHRLQERHSLYYLSLLQEKDLLLHSPEQKAVLHELTEEIYNVREAWDWAVTNQMVQPLCRACTALRQLFELRNWFKEGELTFGRTAEAIPVDRQVGQGDTGLMVVRAALLAHSGFFMFRQGKSAAAYATLAPCVEHLRTTASGSSADPLPLIHSLVYLGIVCWELGRFSEAVERLQEGLRFAQNLEQHWFEAHLNEFLGIVANDRGEYEQAGQYLNRALALFRRFGDQIFTAHTLSYLGRTMHALGEYPEAEKLLRESLTIAREMDYRFGRGLALDALGQLACAQGNYPEAQECFLESASLFKDMCDTHRLARSLNHQGMAALSQNQLSEAKRAFQDALELAQSGGWTPVALAALAGQAALQVCERADRQTLELVLDILQHPGTSQETKDLASGLQKELETKLSAQDIEAAHRACVEIDPNELIRYWKERYS